MAPAFSCIGNIKKLHKECERGEYWGRDKEFGGIETLFPSEVGNYLRGNTPGEGLLIVSKRHIVVIPFSHLEAIRCY